MRNAALASVALLATPIALMAQTPIAGSKLDSLATQVASTSTSVNFVWTLVAGFLVMFMQAGFALVETGVTYNASIFAYFLFQMVFMDTTATIPTGAAAERWKFSSFCIFTVFIAGIIYPVYGNWVWGNGWL